MKLWIEVTVKWPVRVFWGSLGLSLPLEYANKKSQGVLQTGQLSFRYQREKLLLMANLSKPSLQHQEMHRH